MAERRMFAKRVIDSDGFLDMPGSARLLYYDLGMRADDDGFVDSPKKIMRMTGASPDDLNILVLKNFIIPFDIGVVVIKHWKIHNYIRKDTYRETDYREQKRLLDTGDDNVYRVISGTDAELSYTGRRRDADVTLTQESKEKDNTDKSKENNSLTGITKEKTEKKTPENICQKREKNASEKHKHAKQKQCNGRYGNDNQAACRSGGGLKEWSRL